MWKEIIKEGPSMPENEFAWPREMGKIEDGLQSFIDHWQSSSDYDSVGIYARTHGPLISHWILMWKTLFAPLLDILMEGMRLQKELCPKSQVQASADTPFFFKLGSFERTLQLICTIGIKQLMTNTFILTGNDVFTIEFMILRPRYQDINHPIWVNDA